jgi:hypothetical protein
MPIDARACPRGRQVCAAATLLALTDACGTALGLHPRQMDMAFDLLFANRRRRHTALHRVGCAQATSVLVRLPGPISIGDRKK